MVAQGTKAESHTGLGIIYDFLLLGFVALMKIGNAQASTWCRHGYDAVEVVPDLKPAAVRAEGKQSKVSGELGGLGAGSFPRTLHQLNFLSPRSPDQVTLTSV